MRASLRSSLVPPFVAAFAASAIVTSAALAQAHIVGIDESGALLHNRRTLNNKFVKEAVVRVEELPPPKTITVTNRTGFDVKVYEYDAGDVVMAVARKGTVLKHTKSMTVRNDGSNIKVFRPALLDQYLTMHRNARSDLTIAQVGRETKISVGARRYFTIVNAAKEDVKIAVYNHDDGLQAIPKYVTTLKPGATTQVSDDLGDKFRVSVFWPQLVDWKAWSQIVNRNARVTVGRPDWTGWQTVRKASWVKGDLAVDNEENASGRQASGYSNNKQRYLYALDEYGEVWQLNMEIDGGSEPPAFVWDKQWMANGLKGQLWVGMSVISTGRDLLDGSGRRNQDIFALDPSGEVITKRMADYAGPWTKLGGKFAARPAAVEWGNGNVSVYAIDPSDRTLRERTFRAETGKWDPSWVNLGGTLVDAPTVIATRYGNDVKLRVAVFARGADGRLWHRSWYDGTGWEPWESLGGQITSSPVAVEDGRLPRGWTGWDGPYKPIIRVVARGVAGDCQLITFNGEKWGAWESLGGKFRSGPIIF